MIGEVRAPRPHARLRLTVSGCGPPRRLAFDKDEVLVGRSDECDVVLSSSEVSKCHARFCLRGERLLVEDLGSRNGTFLDGARLRESRAVPPGVRVTIGRFSLTAAAEAAGAPAVAPRESAGAAGQGSAAPSSPCWPERRRRVHDQLIEALDRRGVDLGALNDAALRDRAERSLDDILQALVLAGELSAAERARMRAEVLDEALGLGPLEALLADPEVSEIMVNGARSIYVERQGVLQKSSLCFSSDRAVLRVIERVVAPLGRHVDEASPLVDARLKDGSRVNAIIPPLALVGPCLTVRKFRRELLRVEDLVRLGTLSPAMAEFLGLCVRARKNVVISGGTGSGKTTTLNVLSSFIPVTERIVTIEDAAELQLAQAHWVALEARPPNLEGRGQVTIRDLVRNSLRMRPDRIVVGECRGGEALDMLQAMNTGHDGSLTTLHANSPRDALSRLETMVLMAGMDLPLRAIREQIASAVDVLVQQCRLADGSRRVTQICEVTGMEGEVVTLQDLFRFERRGVDAQGRLQGRFEAAGVVPSFCEELARRGIAIDYGLFQDA